MVDASIAKPVNLEFNAAAAVWVSVGRSVISGLSVVEVVNS